MELPRHCADLHAGLDDLPRSLSGRGASNLVRFLAEHAARQSLSSTHPRLAANAALPKAGAK